MNVLVFGVSGMLGRQVVAEAGRRGHTVFSPSHGQAPIENSARLQSQFVGADVVVNCAGQIDTRSLSDVLCANVLGASNLAVLCSRLGKRLIHVSTDCVFSGAIGPSYHYDVDDTPTPLDIYGASKRLGELVILQDCPSALIVRTSFIGPEHGLLPWLRSSEGANIEGWTNALWSGSTVQEVARALVSEAEHGALRGIQHLATQAPISKYDLLVLLADTLHIGVAIAPVDEPQCNRSLEPTIILPPISEAIAALREQQVPA